ncbi:MAG: tyrosine recombinase [Eubacteriales bacterium]|nr:tyrosine recombinase [Eubacteriales bacterium]
MINAIQEYIVYLHDVRKISYNTEVSYKRDLEKAALYLQAQAVHEVREITETDLNSYMLYLERKKMSAATVSRNIAALHSFFQYLLRRHMIDEDPSERLKPPRIEKKAPEILTAAEADQLLKMPNRKTDKGMRDRAMLQLLYTTGIRVSELVHLKLGDVNLDLGYIACTESGRERMIPLDAGMRIILEEYLEEARNRLLKGLESEYLFCNCSGKAMSRQGFWKLLKGYAAEAGITKDITPHTMRHSFAANQLQKGVDIRSVQRILGHADVATTQMYAGMIH